MIRSPKLPRLSPPSLEPGRPTDSISRNRVLGTVRRIGSFLRSTSSLLACGLLVPVVLIGVLLLGTALTPGYSQLADTISDLAEQNRPHAIVMRLGMIVCGFLIGAFVTGLRRVIPTRYRHAALALYGVGGFAILTGVFQDFGPDPGGPRNTEGYLHTIAATCLIVLILLSMAFTARGAAGSPSTARWASLVYPSRFLLAAAIGCCLFFLFGPDRLEGLSQRGIFAASLIWLIIVAVTALRIEATHRGVRPSIDNGSKTRNTVPGD